MSWTRTLSEDWIKTRTWDLPDDFDALCSALGFPDKRPRFTLWKALRKLTTTPAWRAAPPDIQKAVHAYIGRPLPLNPVTLLPMKPLSK